MLRLIATLAALGLAATLTGCAVAPYGYPAYGQPYYPYYPDYGYGYGYGYTPAYGSINIWGGGGGCCYYGHGYWHGGHGGHGGWHGGGSHGGGSHGGGGGGSWAGGGRGR